MTPLAPTPKRSKRGRNLTVSEAKRDSSKFMRDHEEMLPVLRKRCQIMGYNPTEANLRRVKAQHYECEAGREIERQGFDQSLWSTVTTVRNVWEARCKNLGIDAYPKCTSTQYKTDHMPTDNSSAPIPTEQERIDADKRNASAWIKIETKMRLVNQNAYSVLKRVILNDKPPTEAFIRDLKGLTKLMNE